MSSSRETLEYYIAVADLSSSEQLELQEKIQFFLEQRNQRAPEKHRALVFVKNQEQKSLAAVLRANPEAQALLSGFQLTVGNSRRGQATFQELDPSLRFPLYRSLEKLRENGALVGKKLIFAGNLEKKIREMLKLGISVSVTLHTEKREEAFASFSLDQLDQLPLLGSETEDSNISAVIPIIHPEQLDPEHTDTAGPGIKVQKINSIEFGDIWFDGVIHLDSEGGESWLQSSLQETLEKVESQSQQEQKEREKEQEREFSNYLHAKKLLVVLPAEINSIITQQFQLDSWQNITSFSSVAELSGQLHNGVSDDIIQELEKVSYEPVNDILDGEERDRFYLAMLNEEVLFEKLEEELRGQGSYLNLLGTELVQQLFTEFSESYVDQLLNGLWEKSFSFFYSRLHEQVQRFLSINFFKNREHALAAWNSLDQNDRDIFLAENTPSILATLNLIRTPLFRELFPEQEVDADYEYDSTRMFSQMSPKFRKIRFDLFKKSLGEFRLTAMQWRQKFSKTQFDQLISYYISLMTEEFLRQLRPGLRLQFNRKAAILDETKIKEMILKIPLKAKLVILLENRESIMIKVHLEPEHLLRVLRHKKRFTLAGSLLLGLKQFNRRESKTGLFQQIIQAENLKKERIHELALYLCGPTGRSALEKLCAFYSIITPGYDLLICRKEDQERLVHYREALEALKLPIDEQVDLELFRIFQEQHLDFQQYDQLANSVHAKIKQLEDKIRAAEQEDPISGYLLGTMSMVMRMVGKILLNQGDASLLKQLDERKEVQLRIFGERKQLVETIRQEWDQTQSALRKMSLKEKKQRELMQAQEQKVQEKLAALQDDMKKMDGAQSTLDSVEGEFELIKQEQRNLAGRFYQILKPIMIPFLTDSSSKLLHQIKKIFIKHEILRKREIFMFSDEEIRAFSHLKIVFVSDDPKLLEFIHYCLGLDQLEDQLLQVCTTGSFPEKPDLLILGDDVSHLDFSAFLPEAYIFTLGAMDFYAALKEIESQKLQVEKKQLQVQKQIQAAKQLLKQEGGSLRQMITRKKQLQQMVNAFRERTKQITAQSTQQQKELKMSQVEVEMLSEKFTSIDEQFEEAYDLISTMVAPKATAIEEVRESLTEQSKVLPEKLLRITKDLSILILVKTVKESAEKIAAETFAELKKWVELQHKFRYSSLKNAELVVAHDGTTESKNLTRQMPGVIAQHLGVFESQVQEMSFARLESDVMDHDAQYQFVLILWRQQEDQLEKASRLLKKLKKKMKNCYFLVLTPYQLSLQEQGPLITNLHVIRDCATLVNSQDRDFSNSLHLQQLLQEVAPL